MYTVKELIEALSECPEDYEVHMTPDCMVFDIVSIGIDHNSQTVDLFDY